MKNNPYICGQLNNKPLTVNIMNNPTKVVTGKVRFSYAHVFTPTPVSESSDEKKYNVSIIIPKSDTKTLGAIRKAIDEALKAKFGQKIPKSYKNPLRDGDLEREDEAYANSMFLSAKSNNKPGVVDQDLNPILDPSEFYSGCYGRVSLNFYGFDVNGSKGVACGLLNLQKLEEGERLAGAGSTPEQDFGSDTGDDLM